MKPIQDSYPFFETNQVLTSCQLNQIFNYLDEQERLTRANLIGIGIECGLEIRPDTNGGAQIIHLSRGCGVSSAGYLLIEPVDVTLVSYQVYTLPAEVDYPQFKYESAGKSVQYSLWEMFPDGEPNTILLGKEKGFLDNKAVILFLELKKEGLRNCSASNCDDKGSAVTATVRRLLIGKDDLSKIIATANQFGTEYTATDIESALLLRLNLPDLRLPRYNVPNTAPVSSNDVLAAFLAVFQQYKLAGHTGDVLSKTYSAFKPLFADIYPADPFAGFSTTFGFLDGVPATTGQVRFLPYYFDFFDDLIQAYEEFRWKGAGLLCACCPPEELFPRHLMLGLINPGSVSNPGIYRNDFLSSPAIKGCEERKAEVLQLFCRLVEMVNQFTNNPTPPDFTNKEVARKYIPVRVTPSKLGDMPLSARAIPYYYLQNGTPPLFQLWNVDKTRRNRANQNLSFRSDEYIPAAPLFVTDALQYDLEPYNFFRIEGHLGKNVKSVMRTLLELKTSNRLPIGIIALRTGEFDARIPVDLTKEVCRFQDLEALFDALRDEFINSLGKTLESFNRRKVIKDVIVAERAIAEAATSYSEVLLSISNYLKNRLISDFSLTVFRDLFNQLENLNAQYKNQATPGNNEWNDLFNLIEAVRYACQMESFRSIGEEYTRRLIEVKKKLFLSTFLQNHPGIQHKAGVTVGGTFIIVYHDDPTPMRLLADSAANFRSLKDNFRQVGFASSSSETITKAFERLQVKSDAAQVDPDIQLIINEMSKQIAQPDSAFAKRARQKTAERIIAETVNEFADGTVIADFYLPYICCSGCSAIQYIIPKDPLNFTINIGCTNSDNGAQVVVTPMGGTAPYKIKIDNGDFADLKNDLILTAGKYTLIVIDSDGAVSNPQQIEIPALLALGTPNYDCVGDKGEFVATFQVTGGTPPYAAKTGKWEGSTYISDPLPSKTDTKVIITDSRNCSASLVVNHTCEKPCTLPCEGKSRKCAYRLWLQPSAEGSAYEKYQLLKGVKFRFNGKDINISAAAEVLQIPVDALNKDFKNVMTKTIGKLNDVIQKALIEALGDIGKNRLVISYEPSDSDPFGILWIEYFICETFNIEFECLIAKPSQGNNLIFRYTNEPDDTGKTFNGTITTNRELKKQTIVPALDCRERNQCSGSDYVKLCTDSGLKPNFVIESSGNGIFLFQSTGKDKNLVAWVWDVLNTEINEPFYVGERTQATVPKPIGIVRLTVINANGCFAFTENKFLQ